MPPPGQRKALRREGSGLRGGLAILIRPRTEGTSQRAGRAGQPDAAGPAGKKGALAFG